MFPSNKDTGASKDALGKQEPFYVPHVGSRHKRRVTQSTLPFSRLFCENMTDKSLITPHSPSGREPKTFHGTPITFHFWHWITLHSQAAPSLRTEDCYVDEKLSLGRAWT
jgi:hypothetical protein